MGKKKTGKASEEGKGGKDKNLGVGTSQRGWGKRATSPNTNGVPAGRSRQCLRKRQEFKGGGTTKKVTACFREENVFIEKSKKHQKKEENGEGRKAQKLGKKRGGGDQNSSS